MSNIPNDVGLLLGFRAADVGLDCYWAFSSYLCVPSTSLSPMTREGELGLTRPEMGIGLGDSGQLTEYQPDSCLVRA